MTREADLDPFRNSATEETSNVRGFTNTRPRTRHRTTKDGERNQRQPPQLPSKNLRVVVDVLCVPSVPPERRPHRFHRSVAHARRTASTDGGFSFSADDEGGEVVEVLREVGTSRVELDATEGGDGAEEGEDGVVLDRVECAGVIEVEGEEFGGEEGLEAPEVGQKDVDGVCVGGKAKRVSGRRWRGGEKDNVPRRRIAQTSVTRLVLSVPA